MTRSAWLLSLLLLSASACARGPGGGSERPGGDQATAQRIYMVAEERYAAGAYAEAVELMRHALLQLPATPQHDRLRHQLVLRMAHTQLRDHAATGEAAPLQDAQQMLLRYAGRHEALFGESQQARAERGEVYELLFLVEQRLEPASDEARAIETPEPDVLAAAPIPADEPFALEPLEPVPSEEGLAHSDAAAEAGEPTPVPEPPPEDLVAAASDFDDEGPALSSTHGVDEEGDQVRDLVVHKGRRAPSIDDPGVIESLRSSFSTPWGTLVLTQPGVAMIHGPRPLVRGSSRLVGQGDMHDRQLARRAGQSLLHDARVSLRSCYAEAFARQPVIALQSTVEASIHPDGSVSHVRIVDGGIIDGYGDACVIEAMQGTTVEPLAEGEEPVRVELALTFFYESAKYMIESGDQKPAVGYGGPPGLPAIDQSAGVAGRTRARLRSQQFFP